MRLKGILITVVVLLAVLFAATNWASLTTPLPINLLFTTVQVSLGLALLLLAVGLAAVFFILSLLDRAGQLQQISALERHLSAAQAKLDKKRLEEFEALEANLKERLGALEARLVDAGDRRQKVLEERLGRLEGQVDARLDEVNERVLMVRNELAADIAKTEDVLRGQTAEPGAGLESY